MTTELPGYYSDLAPFRTVFQSGYPILTYHKLGPRPSGVRLKGLYLSESLFAAQLKQLKASAFTSGSLDRWNTQRGQVILTFDDGYVNVLVHGLKPLAETGFRAIQFLPVNFLGKTNEWDVAVGEQPEKIMDAAQVREWLAAGHEIGSHSLSHPFLTRVNPESAREEITASRKKLEDIFSRAVHHFCYPYGDWNKGVQDWVAEAGYKTACTTISGVNQAEDCPFSLRRMTARYPSRNLKAIWNRITR